MRVLLIKTSSMGDVIHCLPAVTDAQKQFPELKLDWVVEEGFAAIPGWHPAVDRVIPVAIRRWRQAWLKSRSEIKNVLQTIREREYDFVIDAQGLIKSAVFTRMARGPRYGLDRYSVREPMASRAYQYPIAVAKGQHAIERLRQLFAAVLNYPVPTAPVHYGLSRTQFEPLAQLQSPYVVFLHGTTWPSKHWPESYWIELAQRASQDQFRIYLPWGNAAEHQRAQRIAEAVPDAEVLPQMGLNQLAAVLAHASGAIGVDSGLIHLAAALDVPGVTLYGSTNAGLTGTLGPRQQCLQAEFECAPCLQRECSYTGASTVQPACYEQLPPEVVWRSWLKQSAGRD